MAPPAELVTVSMGNFGQALAYAGSRRGVPVTVFVPEQIGAGKQRRMSALGATVVPVPGDSAAAVEAALAFVAAHPQHRFVRDGDEVAVAEGAATIGLELLAGRPDTVVVPVGDGALINGVACAMKHHDPSVRVVGVCATGAPSMALSWRRRERVSTGSADTFAEGIAISAPIEASLRRLYALADDMVLVDDAALGRAMDLAARTLGVLLEPSGAAGLAALAEHDLRAGRVAVVLTGANPNEGDPQAR